MSRRTLLFLTPVALLLAVMAGWATTSLAQGVAAPGLLNQAPSDPAEKFANSPIKPPAPDFNNPPEALRAGVALRNSLTAQQKAQARAVADKYASELKALSPAGGAQNVRGHAAKLSELAAKIDAELANTLTADQRANLAAATSRKLDTSLLNATPVEALSPSAGSTQSSNPYDQGYCWYGGYYESLAEYYKYYGYVYAYYNYYTYGDDYAYYGYYYAYYAYYYGYYALQYLGAAYFSNYWWGYDFYSWGYYAYYYAYYDYYYAYYGYYYSYYSYYYYSHDYAYYAYIYDYYGQYYGYYGYLYAYYYCQ